MPEPQPRQRSGSGVAALIGAAALLATTTLTAPSEGLRLKPYWDPAHIRSYCFGETKNVQERAYTKAECELLLQNRVMRDYGPQIAACLPEIAADPKRVKIFAAFIDAGYNAGVSAVCVSSMAAKARLGDLSGACAAFTAKTRVGTLMTEGWFVTARYRGPAEPATVMRAHGWTWDGRNWRKQLPGLVGRRIKEAALCSQGARST